MLFFTPLLLFSDVFRDLKIYENSFFFYVYRNIKQFTLFIILDNESHKTMCEK